MPMRTMLKRWPSMPSSRSSTRTWPTISPAVRLRMMPMRPVRQNAHFIAQPTCVEMQNVCDGVSGMKTDSMRWPSASSQQELRRAVGRPLHAWRRPACRSTADSAKRRRAARARGRSSPRSRSRRGDGSTGRSGGRESAADRWRRGAASSSCELELGRVDGNGCGHAAVLEREQDPSLYYARADALVGRVSALNCTSRRVVSFLFRVSALTPSNSSTCVAFA